MKKTILVDSVKLYHRDTFNEADPYDHCSLGIKFSLHKEGCKSRQFGVVARYSNGLSAEALGFIMEDWRDQLRAIERRVRYGRKTDFARKKKILSGRGQVYPD